MVEEMFCFQCQETMHNTGCTKRGVCGKKADLAALEDLLIYATKGLAEITTGLRKEGAKIDKEINHTITFNLFMTITNANFDTEAFYKRIEYTTNMSNKIIKKLSNKPRFHEAALWSPKNRDEINSKAKTARVLIVKDEDIRSLKEFITYGVKGMSAYVRHANVLDYDDDNVDAFIQRALAATLKTNIEKEDLLIMLLETGKFGVAAMALLDKANTSTYGMPSITKVNIGVGKNPGILVSGHDLKDLEMLLKQTENEGVDIYTHSEMLPANAYPAFKKYKNLIGNYGNAWWKQKEEFESFNGPILMTTNCIVPPSDSYKDRLYTTGTAGYEGCKHIEGSIKDFSEIIEHAKKCEPPKEIEKGDITIGFAHNQVLELKDKIIEEIKKGTIKKFVVMGGCDGRFPYRSYYTDFAKGLPKDTVILTAGCAKYRYNKLNLGNINGVPRVLDAGQCNDSYSIALTALKLQELFKLSDINDLPIVYNIAWYEQKAIIVFLSLLYLGIKNIHVGPTLPAFVSKDILHTLIDKFRIQGISDVNKDLKIFGF